MTPHDRELGSLTEQLKGEIHARRNMKMILDGIVADLIELRGQVDRLRVTIRTTLSVLAIAIGVLAWLIEIALRTP
jgi:hypothetical protein